MAAFVLTLPLSASASRADADPATFNVNTGTDEFDENNPSSPGCSLREAIYANNNRLASFGGCTTTGTTWATTAINITTSSSVVLTRGAIHVSQNLNIGPLGHDGRQQDITGTSWIDNVYFQYNSSSAGRGGGLFVSSSSPSVITISDSTLIGNTAPDSPDCYALYQTATGAPNYVSNYDDCPL